MDHFRKSVIAVALVAIVLVNLWHAVGMPYLTASAPRQVGEGSVSVYAFDRALDAARWAVTVHDERIPAEARPQVRVYVRGDYCGDRDGASSQITLLIIGLALLLCLVRPSPRGTPRAP